MAEQNSRERLEFDMRFILKTVDSRRALPPLDDALLFALDVCVQKEYLSGVLTDRMASGRIVAEIVSPALTPAGLEYLFPSEKVPDRSKPDSGKSGTGSDQNRQKFGKIAKLIFDVIALIAGVLTILSVAGLI